MASRHELKFAANISTMFTEADFLERYELAKNANFDAVECNFDTYNVDFDSLVKKRMDLGIKHILVNSYPGDHPDDYGLCCIPGEECNFVVSLNRAFRFVTSMGVKKVNILAGDFRYGQQKFTFNEYKDQFESCLERALEQLEDHQIVGLLEPLGDRDNYFLTSFEEAVDYLNKFKSPYLKLLLDVYHLHTIEGNVEAGIREYLPYVGHIQISQAPKRHEPSASGELDFTRIFEVLRELRYDDYIGLEYTPSSTTADSLKWKDNI